MNIRSFYLSSAFLLLLACGNNADKQVVTATAGNEPINERQVTLTDEQMRNGNIGIGTPENRDLHRVLKVNGYVDVPPDHMLTVSFPLGGYIEHIGLLPGMPVRKGDVLVTLTDPQFIQLQQDYLTGKSRLQYLEADYKRQKELFESQAASEKTYQQAETEFRSQQVSVKAWEEKLKLIGLNPQQLRTDNISGKVTIQSPINGFVSKVNVNIGQYVSPTDVLFELINPNDYHLNLSVLENDLSSLSIGQAVTCRPNNNSRISYGAKILLVNRNVGKDRSAEVHCHFDRPSPELIPGMFMNAEIVVTKLQAMAVPNDAIVRWQNHPYIFAVKDSNAFEMLSLETGITENGYTEIKMEALPEKIVVKNAYSILMKMKNSTEE